MAHRSGVAPTTPSTTAPYIWIEAAADTDLSGTGVFEFPPDSLDFADFVNLIYTVDAVGTTAKLRLNLVDHDLADAEGNAAVIRSINVTPTFPAAADSRDQAADNSGGREFTDDLIVDIRGQGSSGTSRMWYLECYQITGTNIALVSYTAIRRVGS
jgi:hypothetical protein